MQLNLEEIGRFIQSNRKKLEMTQEELGERLEVSAQAVSNWERGETMPEISVMADLALLFDCSMDAIVNAGKDIGQFRRRVTVAQMREAFECIHRLHDILGEDHFVYSTMASALNAKMNSDIKPAFSNPRIMDAYICECLIGCVRDGNAWVDIQDVKRNIQSPKAAEWTIRCLRELGMK